MVIGNIGPESAKPMSSEELEKMKAKKKINPAPQIKRSAEQQSESDSERISEEGKGKNLDLQA